MRIFYNLVPNDQLLLDINMILLVSDLQSYNLLNLTSLSSLFWDCCWLWDRKGLIWAWSGPEAFQSQWPHWGLLLLQTHGSSALGVGGAELGAPMNQQALQSLGTEWEGLGPLFGLIFCKPPCAKTLGHSCWRGGSRCSLIGPGPRPDGQLLSSVCVWDAKIPAVRQAQAYVSEQTQ